jgi:hypothetical protein
MSNPYSFLNVPVQGACIGPDWRLGNATPCPDVLAVIASGGYVGAQIPGRNQVGPDPGFDALHCGGTDTYITRSFPYVYIDIWRAFRDGIWSSSVAIDVFIRVFDIPQYISVSIRNKPSRVVGKSTSESNYLTCPTAPCAVLTVNDDGSFTLA